MADVIQFSATQFPIYINALQNIYNSIERLEDITDPTVFANMISDIKNNLVTSTNNISSITRKVSNIGVIKINTNKVLNELMKPVVDTITDNEDVIKRNMLYIYETHLHENYTLFGIMTSVDNFNSLISNIRRTMSIHIPIIKNSLSNKSALIESINIIQQILNIVIDAAKTNMNLISRISSLKNDSTKEILKNLTNIHNVSSPLLRGGTRKIRNRSRSLLGGGTSGKGGGIEVLVTAIIGVACNVSMLFDFMANEQKYKDQVDEYNRGVDAYNAEQDAYYAAQDARNAASYKSYLAYTAEMSRLKAAQKEGRLAQYVATPEAHAARSAAAGLSAGSINLIKNWIEQEIYTEALNNATKLRERAIETDTLDAYVASPDYAAYLVAMGSYRAKNFDSDTKSYIINTKRSKAYYEEMARRNAALTARTLVAYAASPQAVAAVAAIAAMGVDGPKSAKLIEDWTTREIAALAARLAERAVKDAQRNEYDEEMKRRMNAAQRGSDVLAEYVASPQAVAAIAAMGVENARLVEDWTTRQIAEYARSAAARAAAAAAAAERAAAQAAAEAAARAAEEARLKEQRIQNTIAYVKEKIENTFTPWSNSAKKSKEIAEQCFARIKPYQEKILKGIETMLSLPCSNIDTIQSIQREIQSYRHDKDINDLYNATASNQGYPDLVSSQMKTLRSVPNFFHVSDVRIVQVIEQAQQIANTIEEYYKVP